MSAAPRFEAQPKLKIANSPQINNKERPRMQYPGKAAVRNERGGESTEIHPLKQEKTGEV